MAKKKSKSKKHGSIALLSVFLVGCVIMIASFFIPAFQFTASSGILGGSTSETWSLLQVLQNSTQGNAYVASILCLVATILAGLMIITGILQFFLRNRNVYFLNLGMSMLAMLSIVIAASFAFTVIDSSGLGVLYNSAVTVHMAIFCYMAGAIAANICAIQRRF